jgi:PAS domain S-box-containing protein
VNEGRFLEVNDTFTKITGFTREETIGRTSFDLNLWIDPEKDRASALEIFHQQGFFRNLEMKMRFKDRKIHDMLWSVDPLVFSGEDCFINVLTEITEFKQLQQDKSRLEAMFVQSQKMEAIGSLAGGIAHDFNNILSAIIGNAEIALLHELSKEHGARYSIEQVCKAARRAKDLVRQILTFSRQKEEKFKEIRIGPIIKEIVEFLRASLPTTIEIRRESTAQSDTIIADPSRIHQLLTNLCTNAAHAMQKTGGILGIRLEDTVMDREAANIYPSLRPGACLKLSVSDTGHGMSDSVRERIFEPYFTTKQVGEGTGLGLAVVHGTVKSLNGAITVESKPEKGSTFTIFLPKSVGMSGVEFEDHEPVPTGVERILLVDDEKSLTNMGKSMLEKLGYTVSTKNSSFEALEHFRKNPGRYDLVITDMTMPGMTGERLAREIMNIRPDMPVILCTGYSELITEESAREIGIREFVMKPLVTRQFANIIRRVLDV